MVGRLEGPGGGIFFPPHGRIVGIEDSIFHPPYTRIKQAAGGPSPSSKLGKIFVYFIKTISSVSFEGKSWLEQNSLAIFQIGNPSPSHTGIWMGFCIHLQCENLVGLLKVKLRRTPLRAPLNGGSTKTGHVPLEF